jgi:hypothetical protein
MAPAERTRRLAEFQDTSKGVEAWLSGRLGSEAAKSVAVESVARFETVLDTLPYLGEKNRNQESLIQAGWLIAIAKAVKAKGLGAQG